MQPGIDYCIEIIPEMGINTFVCFSKGEPWNTYTYIHTYILLNKINSRVNINKIVSDRTIITADSRITIYACGLLISVPFLILTIIAYYITPELKDVYGKAVCCYCGCLALTFVMLVIIQLRNIELSNQTCTNIGKMVYLISYNTYLISHDHWM